MKELIVKNTYDKIVDGKLVIPEFINQIKIDVGFDFNASPRHPYNPLDINDIGFIFKLKK